MARPLTAIQQRMLQRIRAASLAGRNRGHIDPLLSELAAAARNKVRFYPRAKTVEFEGIHFPVGSGVVLATALDPETFQPLVSALRSHQVSNAR
jgi:hypothetical protein